MSSPHEVLELRLQTLSELFDSTPLAYGPGAIRYQAGLAEVLVRLVVLAAGYVRLGQVTAQTCGGPYERRVGGVQGRVEAFYRFFVSDQSQRVTPPSGEVPAVEKDAQHVGVTGFVT
jgi:hypothetical protein